MDCGYILFCVRKSLRISSDAFDGEIEENIAACLQELKRVGVEADPVTPLILKCCELYCKSAFNFNNDSQRFMMAFEKLRDALSLSGDYEVKNNE